MTARLCNKCGRDLPETGADGPCPACLLEWGLGTADPPVAASAAESPDDAPTLAEITYFGDYQLLGEIARGGMGVVYRARQTSLNRIVAVKMILAGQFADPEAVVRFRTEAEAAARLKHPNIVGIHEVGAHEGFRYYSMDFIDGRTLAQCWGDEIISPRQAATWLKMVAEAMEYAHGQGVLHRDIKPSNILIDKQGVPFVTDFGLARRVEGNSELTLSGQVLGSPNYMPPEQAEGRHSDVGPESDVYSLGAVLYHAVTGRAPFMAESVPETLRQVVHREPATPRLLNPALPPDLETICLKCLEKDRTRRYQTARALAEELDRFLKDEPIIARPISRAQRVQRWCRRNPLIAGLTAGLVIVFLLGFAGVSLQWRRAYASNLESVRQVERLNLLTGASHLQDGDWMTAMLWFAEALQSPVITKDADEAHRQRIASILALSPGLTQVITHNGQPLAAAAFSPVHDHLATVGADQCACLWEIPSGKQLFRAAMPSLPHALLFSPDGRWLAVSMVNQTVSLLDAKTGQAAMKPFAHYGGGENWMIHPSFDSSGQYFLTQTETNAVQIWNLVTGAPVGPTIVVGESHERLHFGPGGRLWIKPVRHPYHLYDARSGEKSLLDPEIAKTRNILTTTDGRFFLTSDAGLALWNFTMDPPSRTKLPEGVIWPNVVAASARGERLLFGGSDGFAQIYDSKTGTRLGSPMPHLQRIVQAEFSPDSARVVTCSEDNHLRVWDGFTGEPLTPPILHAHSSSTPLGFSASGRYIFSLHPERAAFVWDLHRPPPDIARLRPMLFGGIGRSAGELDVRRGWDSSFRVRQFDGQKEQALHSLSLRIQPRQGWGDRTGKYLVLEGNLSKAQIWDINTGMPLTPIFPAEHVVDDETHLDVTIPSLASPPGAVRAQAELLAGMRFLPAGGAAVLAIDEILSRWDQRHTHSQNEAVLELASWHESEALAAEKVWDWHAAIFHWTKLRAVKPADPGLPARLAYAQSCAAASRIPPRAPWTPAAALDLSSFYTAPAPIARLSSGLTGGLREFQGVPFDLRGVVRLAHEPQEAGSNARPAEIIVPIGRAVREIHFLHNAEWVLVSAETIIAEVQARYTGASETFPLRLNVEVAGDFWSSKSFRHATVANLWTDHHSNAYLATRQVVRFTWTNPRPLEPIQELRIQAAPGNAIYMLYALSVN